jgi:hypothetical protein
MAPRGLSFQWRVHVLSRDKKVLTKGPEYVGDLQQSIYSTFRVRFGNTTRD